MPPRLFVRDVLPVLLWLIIVFFMSTKAGGASHTNSALDGLLARFFPTLSASLSFAQRDAIHYYTRKAAHITEYAVLGLLMMRALRLSLRRLPPGALWGMAWLLATLYAATDEYHQVFVPGRTPKVTDVMLDSVGALVGVGVMAAWQQRRKRRSTTMG